MILLINPLATTWRYRIPLSILSIGGSIEGHYNYDMLDGNLERDLERTVISSIEQNGVKYVGLTVMPGPQLINSIELSKAIKQKFPSTKIIWGGYFPTLHKNVVLNSGYVDYVIRDQGDFSFRQLIDTLENGGSLGSIKGLSFINGSIYHSENQELIDPNDITPYPYNKLDISRYISRTYIGSRTMNYQSSVGCPFLCGFCAVAAVFKARWIGLDPERITRELLGFKKLYDINGVEFVDNNFFTSEKRTADFSERMLGQGIEWWGEGRPDTMLAYDDNTWRKMKRAGCKMIFFGAESSSQKTLDLMNKGGTQTPDTVLNLVELMRGHGIVPELSFVLGSPSESIDNDLEMDISYIRKIKEINPDSEIVIYVYSPVYFDDAELFQAAKDHGFSYPTTLDDWLLPEWKKHDLRKTPVTPWLKERHISRIKNFERVLNACFPTNSDLKLTETHRRLMRLAGSWRYKLSLYDAPYEIRAMLKAFRYRQPELEGF